MEENFNIRPEVESRQEERLENSLRPQTLDEYIGQTKVKENMKIYIEAAKKRGEALDHCLFYGPPGLGKTTIANIIANEMNSNIKITSGPAIEKPGDLAAILTSLSEFDVLFIDEIHRLSKNVEEILASKVVVAVGRKGANWLVDMCDKYKIKTTAGSVDIGIRYELPDEIMKDINKYMYEGKIIGRPWPFNDKVRTFCQNPSGFVSSEVYDHNLTLVNGHSYKDKKSTNTNLAILVSHNFTYPFNKPIDYGRNVAKNLNELGNGNVVVQRLGDINRGKRTWQEELDKNSVEPTLKSAVPGDITFAIGYRTMTDILQFIKQVDKVVEGFANPDNLLYGPEIKFYSNKLDIDEKFETSIKGLYSIGDGGGMTRGLMMASCSGVQMARNLLEN